MKKIIVILLLSVSFLFGNIGKITGVKGDVVVKRGTLEFIPTIGFILEKSDEIITKDKSKVLLLFSDGTSITVGKSSSMKVNEYLKDEATPSNNKASFGLSKGVFRSITGKIGKVNPSGFKLETKSSSLGIRGSEGVTVVKENGDVKHSTFSGGYYLVSKTTGQTVEIPQGTTAKFEAGKITIFTTTKDDTQESQELNEDKGDGDGDKNGENSNELNNGQKKGDDGENQDGGQIEDTKENNTLNGEKPTQNKIVVTLKETAINNLPTVLKESINSNPVLKYSLSDINENSVAIINFVGIDIDGDSLVYKIVSQPLHGEVTIDTTTGIATYIPQNNYDGTETFSVEVSDGKGGRDIQTVSFEVKNSVIANIQSYTPTGTLESLMVDLANVTKEIVGSDTYENTNILEYGYILDGSSKISTYITGITTPSEVINQYIINNQTATYNGQIASFVNGTTATNGTINLNMNFGTKSFTGAINVGSDWKANINSGTITSYGFNSTNITSATNSAIQNITGSLSGKYYGPTASSVGGTLNLTSPTAGSVNGVFGGVK